MSLPYFLLIVFGFVVLAWLQFKQTAYLKELLEKKSPVLPVSKNQITDPQDDVQDLHEDNPIALSKDLKIQIEGGDGTPYEFKL